MGPAFGIADHGLSGSTARMHSRRPKSVEVRMWPLTSGSKGCKSLTFVPGLGMRPDEHGSSPLRSKYPALPADETSCSTIDLFTVHQA